MSGITSDALAHVGQHDVAVELDLVAEQRRHRMAVGIAADMTEERRPVDGEHVGAAEPERLAEPHREHAGAQRIVHRLADGKVGRQRQRRDDLGAADGVVVERVSMSARLAQFYGRVAPLRSVPARWSDVSPHPALARIEER